MKKKAKTKTKKQNPQKNNCKIWLKNQIIYLNNDKEIDLSLSSSEQKKKTRHGGVKVLIINYLN